MKKQLPKIKKTLKTFILNEDAKIMDKTATKIAITSTLIAINLLTNTIEVKAGHTNHANHSNIVLAGDELNEEYTIIDGEINSTINTNEKSMELNVTKRVWAGSSDNVIYANVDPTLEEKTVSAIHSNHYNLIDENGGSS